jgi:hypothetical protein
VRDALRAVAPALLLLGAACTGARVDPDGYRSVTGHVIAPYALHEACMDVAAGERIEYRFESTEPVHFDLHYRDGAATLMPIVRDGVREHAGIHPVREGRRYCLGWEAGPAGAIVAYRYRVRPQPP